MSDAAEVKDEAAAGEESLFDALARLVPEELQAQYYRVVAHTQHLSPDDEMLRILEAMGILALVTRLTPKEVSDERERFAEMLDAHLQATAKTQKRLIEFGKDIDDRLIKLPKEIELGLNPQQIAKFLGETLRQHFADSGIRETVSALDTTTSAMRKAYQQMASVLKEVSDPHDGVAVRIESANRRIDASVEARATRIDALLRDLRTDLLRVWFPLIAVAAFLIGFSAGMHTQRWRDGSRIQSPSSSADTESNTFMPAPTSAIPSHMVRHR